MTMRPFHLATAALAMTAATMSAAAAQGALTQSWKTKGGWLTELRIHPDGARVCSTGRMGQRPHSFGLSIVRSGKEAMVMVVDRNQPPDGLATEMTFRQGGETVGTVKIKSDGPAFASADPNAGQATNLVANLRDQPLTISVGDRKYETELTGLSEALEQLDRCEADG